MFSSKPDPRLTALNKRADAQDWDAMQKQVVQETNTFARLFGTSSATAGSGLKAPILGL